MLETIKKIRELCIQAGVSEPSLLNFAVTDGQSVVATRYVNSSTDEAASLYFSTGTSFEAASGMDEPVGGSDECHEHLEAAQYRMVCPLNSILYLVLICIYFLGGGACFFYFILF
jgi:hypothetical protein